MEQTTSLETREAADLLGAMWGWALAFALLTLALGLAVVAWPNETLAIVAVIFGLQMFVGGIFRIIAGFKADGSGATVLLIMLGILSIIVGIFLVRHPFNAVEILGLILGAFWVVSGIIEFITAIGDKAMPSRGLAIFSSVIGFLAGVVVLSYPSASLSFLAWLLGLWLVLMATIGIVAAFKMRSLSKSVAA